MRYFAFPDFPSRCRDNREIAADRVTAMRALQIVDYQAIIHFTHKLVGRLASRSYMEVCGVDTRRGYVSSSRGVSRALFPFFLRAVIVIQEVAQYPLLHKHRFLLRDAFAVKRPSAKPTVKCAIIV